MFLFEPIPVSSWLAWFAVLAALILLNEASRRSRVAGWAFFIVLPIAALFQGGPALGRG